MHRHILKWQLTTSTLTERDRNGQTAGAKRMVAWKKSELLWIDGTVATS